MTTTTISADIDAIVKAVDDVHDLAHQLDTAVSAIKTLLTDGATVVEAVRGDVQPVEHVVGQVYDALVALGRDGFSEIVGKAHELLGGTAAAAIPPAPSTPPPTADSQPAPVEGTPTPPPAEPAPVAGTDTADQGGSAAPGVQH